MRLGRVSDPVYRRSILKYGDGGTQKVVQGDRSGVGGWVHPSLGGVCPFSSLVTVTMVKKHIGRIGFYRMGNRLAALGVVGRNVWVNFVFPDWFLESDLEGVMEELYLAAAEVGMEIAGVSAEAVVGMDYPVLTLVGYGEKRQEDFLDLGVVEDGMDLVMTKEAGTEGAVIVAFEREEELLRRFPSSFLDRVHGLFLESSCGGAAEAAALFGVKAIYPIEESGVFGTLWEIAEAAGLGLEVDFKKIPIFQETIEVCEYFRMNPYQIASAGSLIMVAQDGYHLAETLNRSGNRAVVIGRMTGGKDCLIFQDGEKRFLEPPKRDELLKGLIENRIGGYMG